MRLMSVRVGYCDAAAAFTSSMFVPYVCADALNVAVSVESMMGALAYASELPGSDLVSSDVVAVGSLYGFAAALRVGMGDVDA